MLLSGMYTLGINGGVRLGYQDTSAVLLKDGAIVAAVEEERMNRVKLAPGQLPCLSIKEVLRIGGISIHDVDYVASHGSTWGEQYQEILEDYFDKTFGYCPPVTRYHHHMAHAASTYYASGFDEALILTIDASGDGASTQLAVGRNNDIELIERLSRPDSLGIFYSIITQMCGFQRDKDEYKVMGLAPYGDPDAYDLRWLLSIENGRFALDDDFLKKFDPTGPQPSRQQTIYNDKLIDKLGPPRLPDQPIEQRYKDIAASGQKRLEEVVISMVEEMYNKYGISNICLSGGVALNSALNRKLMAKDFVDDLFIQPASSDSGISLGVAQLLSHDKGVTPQPMTSCFLGSSFTDDEIERALHEAGIQYKKVDDPATTAAELVVDDQVIGWFQGGAEFGPRALGARSILANPLNPEMKDIINRKIKFRESFRPFSPSVLEEDLYAYFDGEKARSPYMTINFSVNKPDLISAASHIDHTARLQTVRESDHPTYYAYLKALKEKTGHGITLNTSFNRNNEPIVNHPLDAISTFFGSGLDALIIGSFLVEK